MVTRAKISIIVIVLLMLLAPACGAQTELEPEAETAGEAATTAEEPAGAGEAEDQVEDDSGSTEEAEEQAEADQGPEAETEEDAGDQAEDDADHEAEAAEHGGDDPGPEATAELSAVDLAEGEKLKATATTNIVGDLVSNVAGDMIVLTTMLPAGADPHTFDPAPQDVTVVADADVVFVNGLGLEQFLADLIENAGGDAPVVSLATGVETIEFETMTGDDPGHEEEKEAHHDEEGQAPEADDEAPHDEEGEDHEADGEAHHDEDDPAHEDEHGHAPEGVDPHIWLSPPNAITMVHNIETALSALDPANAAAYQANAAAYAAQLEELDAWVMEQIAAIPEENRKMATDHDAFGYYADRYGLEIVGAVIPNYSTNAEPSARELAALQDAVGAYGVQAIFVGTTVNPVLAERLAADSGIELVPLYTGSLGQAGSGGETYIDMMRSNTEAIVTALQPES